MMRTGKHEDGQVSTPLLIGLGLVAAAGVAGAALLSGDNKNTADETRTRTIQVADETPTDSDREQAELLLQEAGVTAELSNGPDRSKMPSVIEWQGHYLVLQGENHLPVKRSIATPHVTLYEVEKGYVPVSGFSGTDTDTVCGEQKSETVEDGANAAAVTQTADEAVALVGANYQNGVPLRPSYCPQDIGNAWGAGSYVYDGDYNQLAGQDFNESAKIYKAAQLWFDEDWERTHGDPEDEDKVIVISEGGDERSGDPAIKIADFYNSILVDYPVLKREGDDPKGPVTGPGGTYAPPAPDLPVTVTYNVLNPSDYDPNAMQVPIDTIERKIEAILRDKERDLGAVDEVLIITRGIRSENQESGLERARRIQQVFKTAVGDGISVRVYSFGDALPICTANNDECWSMNRSTIAYFVR
jgi:hypothetical protein